MADRLRRLLLIHQNFLGQDLHLAQALRDRGDAVVAIGSRESRPSPAFPCSANPRRSPIWAERRAATSSSGMIGDTGVLPAQQSLVDRLLREKSPPAPVPSLELVELQLPA